jgi:hypothetical protein
MESRDFDEMRPDILEAIEMARAKEEAENPDPCPFVTALCGHVAEIDSAGHPMCSRCGRCEACCGCTCEQCGENLHAWDECFLCLEEDGGETDIDFP